VLDRGPVDRRQRTRQAQADRADVGIRRRAETCTAAAIDFGARAELDVHLETDYWLVACDNLWRWHDGGDGGHHFHYDFSPLEGATVLSGCVWVLFGHLVGQIEEKFWFVLNSGEERQFFFGNE